MVKWAQKQQWLRNANLQQQALIWRTGLMLKSLYLDSHTVDEVSWFDMFTCLILNKIKKNKQPTVVFLSLLYISIFNIIYNTCNEQFLIYDAKTRASCIGPEKWFWFDFLWRVFDFIWDFVRQCSHETSTTVWFILGEGLCDCFSWNNQSVFFSP